MYDATLAETVTIRGDGGDEIEAYLARPMSQGPLGGVVVIHHMPGYDAPTKEIARRFAAEGYNALMPNLYHREAPGAASDDAAAAARGAVVGDHDAAELGCVIVGSAGLENIVGGLGEIVLHHRFGRVNERARLRLASNDFRRLVFGEHQLAKRVGGEAHHCDDDEDEDEEDWDDEDDEDDDDDDSTFIADEEEGDEDVTDIIGDVGGDEET